jgi:hypothetical protein
MGKPCRARLSPDAAPLGGRGNAGYGQRHRSGRPYRRRSLGNRTRAAVVLGISIRTLRNKLNDYAAAGLAVPPPGGEPLLATGE